MFVGEKEKKMKMIIVSADDRNIEFFMDSFNEEIIKCKSTLEVITAIEDNDDIELLIVDYHLEGYNILELLAIVNMLYPGIVTAVLISANDNEAECIILKNGIDRIINTGMSKKVLNAYFLRWIEMNGESAVISMRNIDTELPELGLTKTQVLVVSSLVERENEVLTRKMISEYVWSNPNHSRNVDVHIKVIRDKLRNTKFKFCLRTVRGEGYIWVNEKSKKTH